MVETRSGRRFAVFFFFAACLVLLLGRWVRPVDNVVLTLSAPFAAVLSGAASGVGDAISGVVEGPSLYNENKRLRQQIGELLSKNSQLQAQTRDYAVLKRMVKFDDANSRLSFLTGRVIGIAPDPLSPYIFIDKGQRDRLSTGMSVVDQNGYFVGTISDVLSNSSKVLLMINPSSSIGAVDEQTHASGVVDGQYGNRAQLDYVATRSVLRPGDLVVTAGLMNMYPRNLVIGQITGVDRKNVSLFQTGRLRPAADFQNLSLVQVIRSFKPPATGRKTTKP
ncbi:MAG: hypothetical protein NVS2B16_00560 [Chloroflexota bacterium]